MVEHIIKGIGFVSWTQCDGFAYLGIGVIFLSVLALCSLAISPPDFKSLTFFLARSDMSVFNSFCSKQ